MDERRGGKPIAVVTKMGGDVGVVSYRDLERYALKSESRQLRDPFGSAYVGEGLVEPLYNPAQLVRLLDYSTYHAQCCRTKARDVAGQDWKLVPNPGIETPNETQREVLDDFFSGVSLPLNELLYRVMLDYHAVGWGALELVREEYDPNKPYLALYHHPAHTLRVHRDQTRWCQRIAAKKTWFSQVGTVRMINKETGQFGENIPIGARGSEIMALSAYTPRTSFYGIPDSITAIGAIHGDISRATYNAEFFRNFGVPAFAVLVSGDYDEGVEDPLTGLTELERVIQTHMRTIQEHPHSTLFLSIPSRSGEKVSVQLIPLSVDIKEASFRLFRKDNRDEVLHAHGVPGYRIGVTETGALGGGVAKETLETYFESVVSPAQRMLQHLINTHIVWNGFEAMDWRFEVVGSDRSDDAADLEMLVKLLGVGAVRPIEIARRFAEKYGLSPDEDNPALHAYYLGGRPLGMELAPEEMAAAVRSFAKKIEKEIRGNRAAS